MKLVPARSGLAYFLSLLAGHNYAAELNSDCLGDNLVISIPLQNEKMANILNLSAGNCTDDNIPGGAEKAIVFDEDKALGKLSIPIEECGLKEKLYKDPKTKLRSKEQFYMPTANVTLGQEHDGVDLLFKQYYIAAECGFRTTYDVEFKYNVEYDEDEEEDCQMIDGICVFPAWHADAEFEIVEFTSDKYDDEAQEDEDKIRRPGDDIFLAIIPSKVPKDYDWSVTKCTVTSELGTELTMINPGEVNGTCALDDINLKAAYEDGDFRFSHTIFMLDNPKKSTYSLKCEIELCYKDADESVCKAAGQVCGCAAGYHQNDDEECVENKCECSNGVAASHWNCVNDGDDKCVSCDEGYYLSDDDECKQEMYAFSEFTFSNCGSSGQEGPSLSDCQSSYDAKWTDDDDFFSVPDDAGIQQWTVPKTGTYQIEAYGARGGGTSYYGRGAIYRGDFSLKMGDKIDILVGQMGGWATNAGSGGGASFVVKTDGSVLVVAAGGGGQQYASATSVQYADGQYGSSSGRQGGPGGGAGGTNGSGGKGDTGSGASGGGGYSGDGGKGSYGTGGKSFKNGGKGGDHSSYAAAVGGFGGGGGTHGNSGGGGGGGGYSGGGGGDHTPSNGGGGGSYCSGSNKYGKSVNYGNKGHGKVVIKFKQAARFGILTDADDNQGEKVRVAPHSWYNSKGELVESDFPRNSEDQADFFDGETSA